jgi:hypothetical protein
MISTRRSFAKQLSIGLPLAGVVLLDSGCGTSESEVIRALDVVMSAAEVALATLQATGGISAAEAMVAEMLLANTSTFIDFFEMEVNLTNVTVLQKAAAIENEAVTLGLKSIPPGLPTVIISVFTAVLQDIATLLADAGATTANLLSRGINSPESQKKWTGKISRKDRSVMEDVAYRNGVLRVKLGGTKR